MTLILYIAFSSGSSISSGNFIGSSLLSTGTIDPSFKWIIGMGQPQYLCLEIPQSFNLNDIFFLPIFNFSISFIILVFACSTVNPFRKSELINVPSSTNASDKSLKFLVFLGLSETTSVIWRLSLSLSRQNWLGIFAEKQK